MRLFACAAFAAALFAAGHAAAHEIKAGDLTLSNLEMRASLGANPNTAAYLTIANAGARPDRLLSASCTCAASVIAHRTMNHGGTAMMTPAGPIAIPAKAAAALKPGGMHLMVTGLKAPLKDGAMQEITLRFERAGTIKAGFHVKAKIDGPAETHAGH